MPAPLSPSPSPLATDPAHRAAVKVHGDSAAYAILGTVAVVWGVHWAVIKIGLGSMPPFDYGVLRVVTGLAVVLGVLLARRDLRRPDRADVPVVLSVGLGALAGTIALSNIALQVIPAGRSSILVYTMPLWVAVFGFVFFRMRLGRAEGVGLALGLAGLVVLLNPAVIDWTQPGVVFGTALLLVCAVIWALTTLHIRRHTWHASPLELQPWQLLVAIVPLAILALAFDAGKPIDWTPQTILVLLYSGPLATAFAYWGSQSVTRSLGPLAATTGFLAVPVVALASGWVLLGEPLTAPDLVGMGLILAGVAATSLGGRGTPVVEEAAEI
jgi:drug/metabolite transporter (DMT)-like permease